MQHGELDDDRVLLDGDGRHRRLPRLPEVQPCQ